MIGGGDSFIHPVHFFALGCSCLYFSKKEELLLPKYRLPSTEALTGEHSFTIFSMGWNEEGIGCVVQVKTPMLHTFYPSIELGDSVELLIDTRDVKTSGFNTRFCHHFFFLPEEAEGVLKGEKTHFRGEDAHPLCDPSLLECKTQKTKHGYTMHLFIPSVVLCGYDPSQFSRLGFSYRIHRSKGDAQHFSVMSQDYTVEQQPSLWASVELIKKEET